MEWVSHAGAHRVAEEPACKAQAHVVHPGTIRGKGLAPGQYKSSSFFNECNSISLPRKSTDEKAFSFLGGKSCQCPLQGRLLGSKLMNTTGSSSMMLRGVRDCWVSGWGPRQQSLLDPSTGQAIGHHNNTHHYNADTGSHLTFVLFLAISSQSPQQSFLSNYSSFLFYCVALSS